ncbi:MAG: YggT family protein [Jaaginema sp. PMC 1079.18]|nr:YggT family protein [Jaaginema sp. PMC 1080.18]MEC4850506.1 YggT family protein [Jaaginema sp. PMC 1079.18]MEC4864763.1 YggT family protein [Jaaginema sp. PMC 1078.18]
MTDDGNQYPHEDRPQPPNDARTEEIRRQQALEARRRQEEQRLLAEERRLDIMRRQTMLNKVVNFIYYLVAALEVLLVIRFFLRLSGANAENDFAGLIYAISQPFYAPFSTLFISPTANSNRSVFDVNVLVAIAVYALLAWLVVRLIQILFSE